MNGRIRHPQLVCVVLLALATLCCNALYVPDTLTSTHDEVFVPFVVYLLLTLQDALRNNRTPNEKRTIKSQPYILIILFL